MMPSFYSPIDVAIIRGSRRSMKSWRKYLMTSSGITYSDKFLFGGPEGGGALNVSAHKNISPSKHDDDTSDGAWVPNYQ
jgi:hypothetical protein